MTPCAQFAGKVRSAVMAPARVLSRRGAGRPAGERVHHRRDEQACLLPIRGPRLLACGPRRAGLTMCIDADAGRQRPPGARAAHDRTPAPRPLIPRPFIAHTPARQIFQGDAAVAWFDWTLGSHLGAAHLGARELAMSVRVRPCPPAPRRSPSAGPSSSSPAPSSGALGCHVSCRG
jgi:hypothetical protein